MADEDMPPPLEDMTETLEQARKLRGLRLETQGQSTQGQSTQGARKKGTSTQGAGKDSACLHTIPSNQKTTPVSSSARNTFQTNTASAPKTTASTTAASSAQSGSGDFGGMKKGFLFGGSKASSGSGSQKTKTGSQKSQTDSSKSDPSSKADAIPLIKPKTQGQDSALKLDEVQQAMESTKGFLQDKEWVTDDLLEKVQKNEVLSKRLGDPRFMQAVTEFQTNPQAAMAKYQSNPEMQQFLKEFCGILGEHFTSLGDKQDQQNPAQQQKSSPTAHSGPKITELTDDDTSSSSLSQPSSVPVDPHVQQILSDPANREILMDPKVQQLIQSLRSNPEKAQRMLREGDSAFRLKVDRLISLGLLQFQG